MIFTNSGKMQKRFPIYEVQVRDLPNDRNVLSMRISQEYLTVRVSCRNITKIIFRDPNAEDCPKKIYQHPGLTKFENILFTIIYNQFNEFNLRRDHKRFLSVLIIDIMMTEKIRWNYGDFIEIIDNRVRIGRYTSLLSSTSNVRKIWWKRD